MVEQLPRNPSQQGNARDSTSICMPDEPQWCTRKWYFSKQEIEDHSPSRQDGIGLKKESQLWKLYCSFLQELGITLKVPQVTIANAIMLCHQFYMRQSHAKNDWQTIATVSMFLGCKIEDTLRLRKDVVIAAYEILNKKDPSAPGRIRQKDVYNKQQELLLIGERLVLATIAFDLDIQLPYKPLVAALKRLNLSNDIPRVAWNFVNDWLCTTLCLEYKPHYIAAGSVFLAAKYQKVKLPTKKGNVWWLEFDISPKLLEAVIKHMLLLLEQDKGQAPAPTHGRAAQPAGVVGKPIVSGPKSSIDGSTAGRHSHDGVRVEAGGFGKLASSNSCQNLACGDSNATSKEVLPCQTSEGSVVEDGDSDNRPGIGESDQNTSCKIVPVPNGAGSVVEDGDSENQPGAEDSNQKSSCKIVSVHHRTGSVVEDGDSENQPGAEDSNQKPSCKIVSVYHRTGSVVKDGDNENRPGAQGSNQKSSRKIVSVHKRGGFSDQNSSCKIVSCQNNRHAIDADRIREALKRRRCDKATNRKSAEVTDDEIDIEAWIERKLESEIELESASSEKKRKKGL